MGVISPGNRLGQQTQPTDFAGTHIHMIGIGGCGMSGAAAMLLELGATVSGSDAAPFDGMGPLVSRGARIAISHRREQVQPGTQLVVISAAIPDTNPELLEARRRAIPVIKYAQLLGALMQQRVGVAIAGTHGKSTTTAMCAYLAREAGLDPSFVFGASSQQLGGHSGVGPGRHFIVEACEFDRSFLHLSPHSAAILNIEPDHLDCYGTFARIVEAFSQFAAQVDPGGLLLCNAEELWAQQAATACPGNVETFGMIEGADWQAVNVQFDRGRCAFTVCYKGEPILATKLAIPGEYNAVNALAAIGLALHAGADPAVIATTLPQFTGVSRRLTWRGFGQGVNVVDDYAHHPTEIRLTIAAARRCYEPKRTWVVFQPHQYARTCHLMAEFAESFVGADEVIVPDIYAAREPGAQVAAGSEELVARICRNGGRARYVSSLSAVADHVVEHMAEGDLVMTMGAGDVWKVADELVERICGPDGVRRAPCPVDLVSPGGACEASVSAA